MILETRCGQRSCLAIPDWASVVGDKVKCPLPSSALAQKAMNWVVMLPQEVTHLYVLELLLECGGANVAGT